MSQLFYLSPEQPEKMRPYFPLSQALALHQPAGMRRGPCGVHQTLNYKWVRQPLK